MNNNIINKLIQINLSQNEAKVYASLAEIGQTSAGNIIKQTRLHRSVVYETLDKLINKKLAFKITKKRIAYFQATDPAVILEKAKEQQKIAQELLPELKKLGIAKLPEINIYEGIESYRKFWVEITKKMPIGSIDYVAGSIGNKRLIKRDGNNFLGNFNVFNNDILILISATEPLIIEIRNETLVKTFKNIFDILWELGEKIKI